MNIVGVMYNVHLVYTLTIRHAASGYLADVGTLQLPPSTQKLLCHHDDKLTGNVHV